MDSFTTQPIMASKVGHALLDNGSAGHAQVGLSGLPAGFPANFDTKLAWTGADFKADGSYVYQLTENDLNEINEALDHFKGLGLDGDKVTQATFPLPTLGQNLAGLSRDVHEGRGFVVVRGVNTEAHSVEDLTLIYLGVSAYIAEKRARQDGRGNMLVHIVADTSTKTRETHHRHSTQPITFHTEETGDVVSWLTRATAATGGKCVIASATTVYNVLAASRPDIIRTLSRADWPFAFPKYQCRPVIFNEDGHLVMNFGRAPLMGSVAHPRKAHLPTLSAAQTEALDAIEAVARATEMEITTRAGDMHFINNLSILHRREGFVNGAAAHEKRHLVRMRLQSPENGWAIPKALEREWYTAFDKPADRVWHLENMPDAFFPLRKYPN